MRADGLSAAKNNQDTKQKINYNPLKIGTAPESLNTTIVFPSTWLPILEADFVARTEFEDDLAETSPCALECLQEFARPWMQSSGVLVKKAAASSPLECLLASFRCDN